MKDGTIPVSTDIASKAESLMQRLLTGLVTVTAASVPVLSVDTPVRPGESTEMHTSVGVIASPARLRRRLSGTSNAAVSAAHGYEHVTTPPRVRAQLADMDTSSEPAPQPDFRGAEEPAATG